MNIRIKQWLMQHPKIRQWLWFIVLWISGLLTVIALTYPIKILMNSATLN